MIKKTTMAAPLRSIWNCFRRAPFVVAHITTDFRIQWQDPASIRFKLGPPGAELSCYVPEGIASRQLNFGQSEGQVEIEGCEWGFYWVRPNEMAVSLHSGEMDLEQAVMFVRAVAEKISVGQTGFELRVAGDTRWPSLRRRTPFFG